MVDKAKQPDVPRQDASTTVQSSPTGFANPSHSETSHGGPPLSSPPLPKGKDVQAPPPIYNDGDQGTHTQGPPPGYVKEDQAEALPTYDDSGRGSTITPHPASHPYRPFPNIMTCHSEWTRFKSYFICGASKHERLYTAEVHTGYSLQGLLGAHPGILLHNGTSVKDPVLAACRREAPLAHFGIDSFILLPPLHGQAAIPESSESSRSSGHRDRGAGVVTVTERMRAHAKGGQVTFTFSIEVGEGEKVRRQQFEWRKLNKDQGDCEAKMGDFKLFRLRTARSRNWPPTASEPGDSSSSTTKAASSSSLAGDGELEPELVALLKLGDSIMSTHMFTLQLLGIGPALGERWSLMVVMTACMIWSLRLHGGTTKGKVAVGEKVYGKGR